MTVYVDEAKYHYGRMIMCHMVADTLEELHEMADKIEVKRRWFQKESKTPHYDVCKAKRSLAIEFGAVEVTTRELLRIMKNIRNNGMGNLTET